VLLSVVAEVSEDDLLRDMVFVLEGIDGQFIRFNKEKDCFDVPSEVSVLLFAFAVCCLFHICFDYAEQMHTHAFPMQNPSYEFCEMMSMCLCCYLCDLFSHCPFSSDFKVYVHALRAVVIFDWYLK
jgi:hypothetical protein